MDNAEWRVQLTEIEIKERQTD